MTLAMERTKKFVSPGAWFELSYPAAWYEFEDTEGSFLFYDPERWSGNFRISAFKKDARQPDANRYASSVLREELEQNPSATLVKVGDWDCAYSREAFEEEGAEYVSHIWITGIGNLAFECSFTLPEGGDAAVAERVVASLKARRENVRYPKELIPVRVLEIGEINEAFEWVSGKVKKLLKKDFTGTEEDIDRMQQLVDGGAFALDRREVCQSVGLALGVVLVNEADGLSWMTLIDGRRECPVLRSQATGATASPQELLAGRVRKGKAVDLRETAAEVLSILKREGRDGQ